ncbi:hypothetical protein [Kineosporia sp. NBRC 101731]|uniref:hypothetical protein n=1 Tax=Kineosporia sp. NBRC 101731 TaxID=3032199 RepID=UPI0024A27FA2|nr:hypothetical protein [Kineosporia sp. NBRC 101731]GLY29282.1 hypothetical protein Kisp02_26470 [Kineosporia sp. NBRC 101731]
MPILAIAGVFGLVAPSSASAATGPEGLPVVAGSYIANHVQGPQKVRAPLSLAYTWLDRSTAWGSGPYWSFGNVDMVLQPDNNLVMYPKGDYAKKIYSRHIWASNTTGSGAVRLLLQRDGNLVLYTANYARHVWASNTEDECVGTGLNYPALSAQADSNLVIYCAEPSVYSDWTKPWVASAIWATGTAGS